MAMIICTECRQGLSSYAEKCPNCGCPMAVIQKVLQEEDHANREQERKRREFENSPEGKKQELKHQQSIKEYEKELKQKAEAAERRCRDLRRRGLCVNCGQKKIAKNISRKTLESYGLHYHDGRNVELESLCEDCYCQERNREYDIAGICN